MLCFCRGSGHNGCLDCFSHVRSYNPECPLCRKSFDPQLQLSCNHEMRDLIARATAAMMDDEVRLRVCAFV
jgi:hypothetical protein